MELNELDKIKEVAEQKGFTAWWEMVITSPNNGSIKFTFVKIGDSEFDNMSFSVEIRFNDNSPSKQQALQSIKDKFKKIENIEI